MVFWVVTLCNDVESSLLWKP